MKRMTTPLDRNKIISLKAGQEIFLSGKIYTARDQAHKRLLSAIKKGQKLPVDLKGGIIYYCGPTQAPQGKVIGSCGPTTSARMDIFTPYLLAQGLSGMIGKGSRGTQVQEAIKKNQAVYFVTYAGCGALLSKYVKSVKKVAYGDLGPEAILELKVEDFPLLVAIDCRGRNIYKV